MNTGSVPEAPEVHDGQRRIRALVVVAVLVATILGIVGGTLAFRAYDGAKDDEVERTEQMAMTSADDIAQFVRGRILILEALGTSDSIVRADAAAIQTRLARIDTADLSLDEGVDLVRRRRDGARLDRAPTSRSAGRRRARSPPSSGRPAPAASPCPAGASRSRSTTSRWWSWSSRPATRPGPSTARSSAPSPPRGSTSGRSPNGRSAGGTR